MTRKQKLELTWIGKDNRSKLEPRILLEDTEKSYHAKHRVTENDIFDNRLIFGDNLLALKALEHESAGKVKCIYIDPPFNTKQAFEHYDDGLEHSVWLSLMRDRLILLHRLLSNDGTCCIHIDDNELGYLLVIADEIFGRSNRAYIVTFKQSSVSGPKAINPGLVTTGSYILIYAKEKSSWRPSKVYVPTKRDSRYSKYIVNSEDDYSRWKLITLREALAQTEEVEVKDLKKLYPKSSDLEARFESFVLADPSRVVRTARVAPKDITQACREKRQLSEDNKGTVFRCEREGKTDMYFLNGEQLIFYSSKAKQEDGKWITGEAASTIWDDLLSNNLHNEGQVQFQNGKKPEALIRRILEMCTSQGDLVLDSFAGSGTTGAVAHKMGRRWIMVELGEHCDTHIVPRLTRVVDGKDDSGISNSVGWNGGGGFRYYKLAPSLLEKDKWGNWVISHDYNAAMLAEAACKLEGFTYAPSDAFYWQHGHSTERDFIYVTTQSLSADQLNALSEEVGPDRTLLVLCAAFRGKADRWPNLTVKKIPKQVLNRCEWGHDDYSLKVENLPEAPPDLTPEPSFSRKGQKDNPGQQGLFDEEAGQ